MSDYFGYHLVVKCMSYHDIMTVCLPSLSIISLYTVTVVLTCSYQSHFSKIKYIFNGIFKNVTHTMCSYKLTYLHNILECNICQSFEKGYALISNTCAIHGMLVLSWFLICIDQRTERQSFTRMEGVSNLLRCFPQNKCVDN